MNKGKILLVTGASSDVGAELIRNVGKNYEKVWAHYRSSAAIIEELRKQVGEQVTPVKADFSDLKSTEDFIESIRVSGDIPNHIVHLPAPKVHCLQFHKHTWDSYQLEIDTSLRSITMILQSFIPQMAKKKYGKIVFMLSAYLLGVPPKFQSQYITVKYALFGLMRNLAAEYASKGIMVNGVSPDMMETKFLSELPNLIKEQSAKNNPLGRNIYIQEVIPTIKYLLSSESDAVTGQNIGITWGGR